MPLISIIVTVYNLQEYIKECLESILLQDYDNYELIVVDNGSDDKSVEICEAYAQKYLDKMKFIGLPKPTLPGRAHGVARHHVSGKYVQFIDGDDQLVSGSLKEIGSLLESNIPDALMGTFMTRVEEGATNLRDAKIDSSLINGHNYADVLNYLSKLPNLHPVLWRLILKSEYLDYFFISKVIDVSLKYQVSTLDWVTFSHILLSIDSLYYYDNPFYIYNRRSFGSMTSNGSTEFMRNYFITFIVFLKLIKQNKYEDIKLYFAFTRLKMLLKNFLVSVDKISLKDIELVSEMIDECQEEFVVLKNCGMKELEDLYESLVQYGSYNGLMMFFQLEKFSFLNILPDLVDQEIYIFPTGIKGEATGRLLKKQGLKVKGFLDNDSNKQNKMIGGVPCCDPSVMMSLSKVQRNNTYIVIATLYEYLNDVLTNQLLDMGIQRDHIIIRR